MITLTTSTRNGWRKPLVQAVSILINNWRTTYLFCIISWLLSFKWYIFHWWKTSIFVLVPPFKETNSSWNKANMGYKQTGYVTLFRVRSWNNGMRCMSYYVLMGLASHSQPQQIRLWGKAVCHIQMEIKCTEDFATMCFKISSNYFRTD